MTTIPEPIERQIRQEAGFGCCKCGFPIIEYHHIVRDSQSPKDIMLLCPKHHTEATVGAMLEEEQRFYKAHPSNIENGLVEGKLKVNQKTPVVIIGTNLFVGDGDFLIVDDESLLSIEIYEGRLELSMKLYDQKDNLVAEIERNEWISGDPLPWDLESKFQWVRIRRKLRDIELEIDARRFPIKLRADMWRKGVNFQLRPNKLIFNAPEMRMRDISFARGRIEGVLKVDTLKHVFRVAPRVRKERVKVGSREWEQLGCEHEFVTIIDRKKYTVKECRKCKKIDKIWK